MAEVMAWRGALRRSRIATWSAWLPTYAYAIEHRDGVILVDAGASAGLKRLPRWHPYFRFAVRFDIEPDEEAGPQLRAIGIGSADVKRVVLTHMHIDHDGGLAAFPNSEILVSPGELAVASGIAGRLRGYLPERWPKSFDPKPLVLDNVAFGPFARSRRLTADGAIVAVATPGHTRDHLSVIVDDARPGRLHRRRRLLQRGDDALGNARRRQRRRKRGVGDAERDPGLCGGEADGLFARARSRRR